MATIAGCDVVITSYRELTQSVPWDKVAIGKLRASNRNKWDDLQEDLPEAIERLIKKTLAAGGGGTLHQIDWYRVGCPYEIALRSCKWLIDIAFLGRS